MAFHPFRHFRKRQKVYLAILTILTMFIFVFTGFSGGADPVTRLLYWFGVSRHTGDKVLTLGGQTLYESDVDTLRKHRQLANEFLLFGILRTLDKSIDDIRKKVERDKKDTPDNLGDPVQTALQRLDSIIRNPFLQFQPPETRYPQILDHLQFVQNMLAIRPDVQKNPDQFRALETIATALAFQAWALNVQMQKQQPPEYYLGGTYKVEDLLDFAVWKHQADKLGISLTAADVGREVNRAWGGGEFLKPDERFENQEMVRLYLTTSNKVHRSLGSSDLLNALTDEFRVALAKEAVLGSGSSASSLNPMLYWRDIAREAIEGPYLGIRFYRNAFDGIHHAPTVATPDEFLDYFKGQRTTLAVRMLEISVKDFEKKVGREPNEEDLRNLYQTYKEVEPSPTRRQPGFKEPRRIKVQYLSASPDGPFAKKLAARVTELLPLFRLGGPASTFAAGGGLVWAASLAVPMDVDTALRALYEDYRREEAGRAVKFDKEDASVFGSHIRFGQGIDLNNKRGAEVQAAAAAVGQLLGDAGTGGSLLATPAAWLTTNELYERATLTAYVSTVLAGSSSSPLVAATLPTRYLHTAQPLESVRGQLVERFQTTLARALTQSSLITVREELNKLVAARSEARLDEYVKKAVAEHGLENYHSMSSPQTRQEMLDSPDPALAELRKAYDESPDNPFSMLGEEPTRPDFVEAMFRSFEPTATQRQFGMTRSARSREFRSRSGDRTWVFWRSEDTPAHVRSFDAVRDQVKAAWFLEQARRLARKEAERIAAELKEKHYGPSDAVKFLREQKQGVVFELNNVAHLIPKTSEFRPGIGKLAPSDFKPYQPPKDLIAYPPADLVDQLLKLKEPGDSLVVTDQPVRHFYVAVLMEKPQVPERREFYEVYRTAGADNRLWLEMMASRRHTYYRQLMEQLRGEATKDLEGGEYVIPDTVRTRAESGSSDSGE
jgi:hypothetical protein